MCCGWAWASCRLALTRIRSSVPRKRVWTGSVRVGVARAPLASGALLLAPLWIGRVQAPRQVTVASDGQVKSSQVKSAPQAKGKAQRSFAFPKYHLRSHSHPQATAWP
eukprot:6457572-Prymnesium_polylepis.1